MSKNKVFKILISILLMLCCIVILFILANVVERPSDRSQYSFFDYVFWALNFKDGYGSMFLRGTGITILVSIIGTVCGFVIGLIVGVLRTIPVRPTSGAIKKGAKKFLDWLISVYVEVFRGTPMIVQAMIIYYGLMEAFQIDLSPLIASLIIVSINTGAYLAEIVRGGIESIDVGQFDAAYALGMSHFETMVKVILPQTIRNILPATGNEFVINIKDTSVLNVIALSELYFATKSVKGLTYRTFEMFFVAAVIYLFLTFTITRILRLIEMAMDGKDNYDKAEELEVENAE